MKSAATPRPAPRGAPRAARHEVRIIGGQWRRSLLPVADKPGLRPTPDRVRETLFNWLGHELDGWRVLDAFAGSGALGFEAASRGAAQVLLLERDPGLVKSLRQSQERLKLTTLRVDTAEAVAWMSRCPRASYELVLLDPPFDAGLLPAALVAAAPLVVEGGFVYVEGPAALTADDTPPGLTPWRQGRAGAVFYHLLQRNS